MKKAIPRIIFLAVLPACGAQVSNTKPRKVIEGNDLVPVAANGDNVPEHLRPLIDAFGLMSMGCTGTHIGNGLVLTAGHCFRSKEEAAAICKKTTVDFGFRADVEAYLHTACLEVVVIEKNDTKDFALFRVAQIPRAKVDVDFSSNAKLHTKVTVFGFPSWRPLEWSQYCELGEARQIYDSLVADFTHQCDTEPVSSGSVVIDVDTLKIIGIHDGGLLPWNYGTLIGKTPELTTAIIPKL